MHKTHQQKHFSFNTIQLFSVTYLGLGQTYLPLAISLQLSQDDTEVFPIQLRDLISSLSRTYGENLT